MSTNKPPGWGQIVQLLLRAMDTSPKTENAAMLAERMANGVEALYAGPPLTKPDELYVITCDGVPSCVFENEERAKHFVERRRHTPLGASTLRWELTGVAYNSEDE